MGLFRRKPELEEDAVRCPRCDERVPEGAVECAMCGRDLRDVVSHHEAWEVDVDRAPRA